jgi:hypothetical protein
MLIIRDCLIQSALSWKASAELREFPEGSSQGGAAMLRHEEASPRCQTGWLLGRVGGRASVLQAKTVSPAPAWGSPQARYAVIGQEIDAVRPAIMFEQWRSNPTDEIPRCPGVSHSETGSYKLDTKGLRFAPEAGTTSYWPRLQGYQQRQSRSHYGTERQNHSQLTGQGKPRGTVSLRIQATKWPAGTSSQSSLSTLRNIPLTAQNSRLTASIR